MKKIIIELRNIKALQILKDLELVDLIKILPVEKQKSSASKAVRGSISKRRATQLTKQITEMRAEWNRNT
jgi:hypothetical protein